MHGHYGVEPGDYRHIDGLEAPSAGGGHSIVELDAALGYCAEGNAPDAKGLTVELMRLLPLKAREVFCRLLDKVLEQGLPAIWRGSYITPVPKPSKNLTEATSYRPVAITSLPCRLLERIVLRRMYHAFTPSQRKGDSSQVRGRQCATVVRY